MLHFQGTFQSAGVIQHAYNFNQPICVVPGSVNEGRWKLTALL